MNPPMKDGWSNALVASDAEAANQPVGARLWAVGWRQGSLFSASTLAFASNRLQPGTGEVSVHRRNLKSNESLVIITQDCDIVSVDEQFVEAMICSRTSAERARRLDRNSARWFVVDPDANLVAAARYRLAIEKEALARLTPSPWPADGIRFQRFVRWLGRRYDRPALPDPLVDLCQRPVSDALEAIERNDPGTMALFSKAIHEIRITEPTTELPPFHLYVYLMARNDGAGITEPQTRAIDQISHTILTAVDANVVRIEEPIVRFEAEMSVAEYFRTRPLFLEYHTYSGDEVIGAEPSPSP
mgnify:CR=1 FL=1